MVLLLKPSNGFADKIWRKPPVAPHANITPDKSLAPSFQDTVDLPKAEFEGQHLINERRGSYIVVDSGNTFALSLL
ncbi:hypothetical protein ABHI18_009452 [Aspergillus niger]